jgi:hypothetical protein
MASLAQMQAVTEDQFQAWAMSAAHFLGWDWRYHTFDSRGSEAGMPDLLLVNTKQRRVIFAELKGTRGSLSDAQRTVLEMLRTCGHEAYCWYPADADLVEQILKGHRPDPLPELPPKTKRGAA